MDCIWYRRIDRNIDWCVFPTTRASLRSISWRSGKSASTSCGLPTTSGFYDSYAVVQPPEAVSGQVSVSVHTLNVRSEPSFNHPVITQAYRGEILTVYGQSLRLGGLYYRRRKYEMAIPYYEKVIRSNPKHYQGHYWLAMCYWKLQRYYAAINTLEEVIEFLPTFKDALNLMGECYEQIGEGAKAEHYYLKAISADPDGIIIHGGILDPPSQEKKREERSSTERRPIHGLLVGQEESFGAKEREGMEIGRLPRGQGKSLGDAGVGCCFRERANPREISEAD